MLFIGEERDIKRNRCHIKDKNEPCDFRYVIIISMHD